MIGKRALLPALSLALVFATASAGAQYGGQYSGQNGPPPNGYGQGPYAQDGRYGGPGWDQAPAEFTAARQRGFRDGVEGARKDFENHRPPNVNNRDEYRNPHFIASPDRHEYRVGFRRGYQVGVQHIYGR